MDNGFNQPYQQNQNYGQQPYGQQMYQQNQPYMQQPYQDPYMGQQQYTQPGYTVPTNSFGSVPNMYGQQSVPAGKR